VPGQDAADCLAKIMRHLRRQAPAGLKLEFTEQKVSGNWLHLDVDSPLAGKAARVLRAVTGRDAVFLWDGASIPVIPALAAASGAEPLLVGFGGEDDRVHAPNESFRISQFRLGYRYAVRMIEALQAG